MLDEALEEKYGVPKLTELIDVSSLQQVQDWAARTAGVPMLIRDAEGNPVTVPSMSSSFCNLIAGEEHLNDKCRESNKKAAEQTAASNALSILNGYDTV